MIDVLLVVCLAFAAVVLAFALVSDARRRASARLGAKPASAESSAEEATERNV